MKFFIEHWKPIVLVGAVLCVVIVFAVSLVGAVPSSETIKNWTVPEAIFYGACIIAFATYLGGGK